VALAALTPAHTLFLAQLHAVASRAHLFLKQYVEAQELATKALHGVEVVEREAPHLVGQLRVDMERLSAVVLREQEQWDQAADMLSRAIATARMAGLVQAELAGEIDMVQLLVARGTFADALTHSSVTLPRVRELQLHREIARLLNITSQCYLCLHEPIMALQCADQARDVAETIGDRAALHDALQQRIAALQALNRNTEAQLLSDRLLISRAVSI
jgi:tetratricopeptide (TPR) repeat protein